MFSVQAILLGLVLTGCTRQNEPEKNQKIAPMKNHVAIIEIPTNDFARAVKFYQSILEIKVEEVGMGEVRMGLFPDNDGGVFVQLIHGPDYKPSADGTVVYFNGREDLQGVCDKIQANGGKVVVPKTEIGPEMGFYAIFIDTEGNKLGLHSYH